MRPAASRRLGAGCIFQKYARARKQPVRVPEGPSGLRARLNVDPATEARCAALFTPVVSYAVHGSTVFNPAAANETVSRVATIMALDAAVAAM